MTEDGAGFIKRQKVFACRRHVSRDKPLAGVFARGVKCRNCA